MTLNNGTAPSAQVLVQRNELKNQVKDENLWPSQRQAADELVSLVKQGGLYNLTGSSDSGKTFLAWHLTRTRDSWRYFPWLPVEEKVEAETVIVDNAPPTRSASRRAREIRAFTPVSSVVVVSEEPIPESTNRVVLNGDD